MHTLQDSKPSPKPYDMSSVIDFVDHESFPGLSVTDVQLSPRCSIYADRNFDEQLELDCGGDFEMLRDLPLLSPEGEALLFKKMNLMRYQAEELRKHRADSKVADQAIRQLLEDADAVRNHIAECNLRLVISIARRFSSTNADFDDLMSEGNEILLKAISKFDFSRGFRFSTYATHSVQRHFFRYVQRAKKRNTIEYKSTAEVLNELPEGEMDQSIAEWVREEQRMTSLIARMAERLDEREQQIVVGRYGLGESGVCRTLRELSSELGLSKERVRQLQLIAIDKLRDLFDELDTGLALG